MQVKLFGLEAIELSLIIVALAPLSLWALALIDIARSRFKGRGKASWFLIVFFLPLIGFIIYFSIGRKRKIS